MKALATFLLVAICTNFAFSDSKPVFLSPLPDSKYNKVSSSILLKYEGNTSQLLKESNLIFITGSKSGSHQFTTKFAEDNKSFIITPIDKFDFDENVNVYIANKNRSIEYSFSFFTERQDIKSDVLEIMKRENPFFEKSQVQIPFTNGQSNNNDSLPSDFPNIVVKNSDGPSPGYVFLSNFTMMATTVAPYLIIMDNTGTPVFYKKMPAPCFDFKKQPNGLLTYYSQAAAKFFAMNSQYQVTDSFYCGNGYPTDLHELRLLTNGHALLMSYDPQIVNMRNIIPNGDTAAVVTGLIIQEIDANKNVVFQWRSWDHFNIVDAKHEDMSAHTIDYVHGNSIEPDNDGNILISSRHLSEITKINRTTGAIIWRFGGVNNQFAFANDSITFSYQHAVHRLANGHILLFDNGNYRETSDTDLEGEPRSAYSRAAEYSLDENHLVATLVWHYRRSPDIYGYAMGNAERLENGNTLICWGAINPNITEVNPSGEIVFEMTFPRGIYTYRVFRNSWIPTGLQTNSGNESPKNMNLYQNYPNPFNPSTTIKFDLSEKSKVFMYIYNSIGQKIEEINFGVKSQGSYEYKWNASALASGIYYYRIKTETETLTKQMLLLK